jgi:hypothetical protein
MPLFRSHDDKLLESLTEGVRLTLPANPGPDRMLDACRQHSPAAKPFRLNHDSIYADGKHLCLFPATAVSADMAVRAGLPPDITCAFFVGWAGATNGLNSRMSRMVDQQYVDKSKYLLGGLAARFGGLWYPRPDDVTRPLRVYVFTVRRVDEAGLAGMVARYAGGLGPVATKWSSQNVITLQGDGTPSLVQFWPPDIAKMHTVMFAAGPGVPEVLDPSWADDDVAVITVEAAQVAEGADPGVSRAVGAVGLGLAAETGGVCVDVFGFRVRDPADLVIRAP